MKLNRTFSLMGLALLAYLLIRNGKLNAPYPQGFSVQDRNFLRDHGILLNG